ARFTLDAMPGKQMAIDADLSSGTITEQEARERREKIQGEADFYGAMDGSTKIVKGDAVMSIIITAINFIGGVTIGAVQGGMSFSEVIQVYSIATIGDGLVSQIPALLISSATGMIVTRSVSKGSLNDDVLSQFIAKPTVLILAGMMIGCIILIPGAPWIQPLLVAGGLIGIGMYGKKKQEKALAGVGILPQPQETATEVEFDENTYYKDINNIYALLTIEPIEMEFGYSLIPLVDEGSGGKLINRIVIFRRKLAQEMGFVVPSIRLRNSAILNANEYVIKIKGEVISSGELLVDYYLALEPPEATGVIDGIETIEPAYGIPSKWITKDKRDLAEMYGYTVIDPLSVMVTHLGETIEKHAYEMLNRTEVTQLLENLKTTAPELVAEAVPNVISYSNLQEVLSNLLKEGVPIRDMVTILETVIKHAPQANDVDAMTERIRVALKRTITRKFCDNGQLMVITLDADVEKTILSSLVRNDQGIYLSLSPELTQKLVMQVIEYVQKFSGLSQNPVILTSHVIRPYVYRLIEQFNSNIFVLSFNEIATNVQIQALGNITF
ncbi:MAG: flagellar biosynthesis protein FlhA, partial [Oscillospiraceae bacterium]